jgi:hypothetical protein
MASGISADVDIKVECPGWQVLVDSLVLEASEIDTEIARQGGSFLWQLRPDTWKEVAYQIEPFLPNNHGKWPPGFQWLMGKGALCDPTYSPISLVISSYPDGGW